MSNGYDYGYGNSPGPGPNTPGPRPPKKDDTWENVSWFISITLIFLWFPMGLFLTVLHSAGTDLLGGLLQSLFGSRRRGNASARRYQRPAGGQTWTGRFQNVRHADNGSTVKTVFGWLLVGFGFMATIGSIGEGLWTVLSMIAIMLGGGALVWSAISGKRKEAKFRRCFTVTGDQGVVDIRGLAKTLGMKQEEADKLITEMVDRGFYGEKAYVDRGRMLLVIDVEQMREIYRKEDEASKAQKTADAQEKMTEYERYVELIRQADVEIEDEVMSEKIRRMQELTASIFAEVEAHPEKKSQIDRFMNYYLPTTLKLLKSYARNERQGVSGENMAKAKADIEGIADTLVEGYKKQLDRLYQAEAVDIAGDVSVIENMLKRDGLTGKNDFGTPMGGH